MEVILKLKHKNQKKDDILNNLPELNIITELPKIKELLSFNFKYFDGTQNSGQKFGDLTQEQLLKFFEKLKNFSSASKLHWIKQEHGHSKKGTHTTLEIYDDFPEESLFKYPKHVPAGVKWARFRLEGDMRLAGFFIDENDAEGDNSLCNIFYVVFFDSNHGFYKTQKG